MNEYKHRFSLPGTLKLSANVVDRIGYCLLAALSLLPILNILYILAATGDNNLSNDYALFLPLIDSILKGNYDWRHFFQDTFFVSHFQPLPILVYLANALLTGWNVYYELFFIAFLSIIRVYLSYQALTSLSLKRFRIFMLPVLAMLIFSNSQISSYEFGASAVPLGLTAFGFTLAVWGLVRFSGRFTALVFMAIGGLIASWTAASGVIAWPIFLAGMLLLGYKKLAHYLTWLVSAIIINFPYLYFLVIDRQPGTNAYLQSLFNPRLIANLIGRPFANGIGSTTEYIPLGEAAGWLGLLLGLGGVLIILAGWKKLSTTAAPALMFMAFGFLCAWQTSLFRVMIAPWYTNMVMPYWVGLVGLAYVLISSLNRADENSRTAWVFKQPMRWSYFALVMLILAGLYLATNLTYRDKSFYLASRRPVSAACLRSYAWAPTYCERFVFQWTVNRVYLENFAWPLQDHNVSVFASHQRWSMQGDVVLGKVYSPESSNTLGVQWMDGFPGAPASYTDFRHLNLLVSPANSIAWTIDLPEALKSAELVSAIGIGDGYARESGGEPVTFEILLSQPGQIEELVYSQLIDVTDRGWQKLRISLSSYQGQTITLRFAVKGGNGDLAALFRFPYINLTRQPEASPPIRPVVRPINTDLSSSAPQPQPDDHIFNLNEAQLNGLVSLGEVGSVWTVQTDPYFYLLMQAPLSLADYGWVSFTISASTDIPSRAAELFIYLEGKDQPFYIMIPLLADGEAHTYSYPLQMLESTGNLVALRLDPVMVPSSKGENMVTVEDLRLIHLP
jgi:hypothetical protein